MAVVFITKIENGVSMNEGYCLKCARSLGIPQIDAAVKQMGFSDEDLDTLSDEMSNVFGQIDGEDPDEAESRTATFPMLNQLFGSIGAEGGNLPAKKKEPPQEQQNAKEKGTHDRVTKKKHPARPGQGVYGRIIENGDFV